MGTACFPKKNSELEDQRHTRLCLKCAAYGMCCSLVIWHNQHKKYGNVLPTNLYNVGDETFPLKKYLLRPYPRVQLNDKGRIFNYRLSRARRVIENAFGILVSRWRILTKLLCCSPENAEHLVKALICLTISL